MSNERNHDMGEHAPGDEPDVNESGYRRAIQAAKAAGRAEGFEEGRAMAEAASVNPTKRWTDHWQVKALIGIVLFFVTTTTPGLLWMVSQAVSNQSKNVEQDMRIQKGEERWAEYRDEQKAQRQILEDIRREVKK